MATFEVLIHISFRIEEVLYELMFRKFPSKVRKKKTFENLGSLHVISQCENESLTVNLQDKFHIIYIYICIGCI